MNPLATHEMAGASDPIVIAIRDFRGAIAAFNALPTVDTEEQMDAQVEQTYGPLSLVLMAWDGPAHSHEGAVEALRLAVEENEDYSGSDIADAMVKAALAYLEQAA